MAGDRLAQFEDHALAGEHRWKLIGVGELAGAILEQLERAVGALGLVVKEHQAAGADCTTERDGVVDAGVSPADLRAVLLVKVLRVV